jgi:16S rRNA (guanine1207-N2)-methyltransferase
MSEGTPHYFSSTPDGPEVRRSILVRLRGRELAVTTAPAVFSGDRLDLGTSVLLREAPTPPQTGHLLDLGCGWGPMTLALAHEAPRATIWAVDVNSRARELTRANALADGATGVRVCAPAEVPADLRFDLIWSNPPIRIGKKELHALLERWLPRLTPGGVAYLVVQRNLGADSLHAWLVQRMKQLIGPGADVTRWGSAKGFRVLQVSVPNANDATAHPVDAVHEQPPT